MPDSHQPRRPVRRAQARRISRFPFALMLLLALLAGAASAPAQDMPLTITERLWQTPGPEQSGPGAPRLLITCPEKNLSPDTYKRMRYAGRVEPEEAAVTLNGQPVERFPGGVFVGTRELSGATTETWRFTATTGGKSTTVERVIRRPVEPPPAPAWPLTFFQRPVSPSGDIWLKSGDTLKVTLYASAGRRAELRIGPNGTWKKMTEGERDRDRGGVYKITLDAPKVQSAPKLQTVYFRLSGNEKGQQQSKELTSRLKVATVPSGKRLWAQVSDEWATFLKNAAPSDWARWGNWIKGTPFPVLEGRSGRLRTDFGAGESGYIESSAAKLATTFQRQSRPALGRPEITSSNRALTLAWPSVKRPVACVFYPETAPGGGATLRVSLPGAYSLRKFSRTMSSGGFKSVESVTAKKGGAPAITIKLGEPLWGYEMVCDAQHGLRIVVRARPRVGAPGKPLSGLRVMLDAGHGGPSKGAVGASGLEEKDINLVQAAWLGKFLKEMGAEVKQTRRTDVDLDLDQRCVLADEWNPDIFVSLHHNSMGYEGNPLGDTGPIVFYHYPHSKPLADAIAASMASRLHAEKGKRVMSQNFRVNRDVMSCPSVLTESAYICNPHDELKLRQADTLKASAQAIALGIKALFEK